MSEPAFKLPTDSQRIAVIGRTGSGKTQAATWLLAQRNFSKMPWIVIDFKRDELVNGISGLKHIKIDKPPPNKPGLYAVHPLPGQEEHIENFLWKVWQQEKTGIYIDEALMIDKRSEALQAILTQGRSKKIPLIIATQRPVEVSRFVFSEAEYIWLFGLTDTRDIKTVKQFMPMKIDAPLPPYHSYWFDAPRQYKAILQPVPNEHSIHEQFKAKIGPARPSF